MVISDLFKKIKEIFTWKCPKCGSRRFYPTYGGRRCANDECDWSDDWRL